jgi:hypothetical protein
MTRKAGSSKRRTLRVEDLDNLGKIGKRAGQPVDFVNATTPLDQGDQEGTLAAMSGPIRLTSISASR